jgi:hypothetical protein
MSTTVSDAIAAAFQATLYLVFAPTGTITLRIGQHSPELQALMTTHGRESLAILTAHNPGARRQASPRTGARKKRCAKRFLQLDCPASTAGTWRATAKVPMSPPWL